MKTNIKTYKFSMEGMNKAVLGLDDNLYTIKGNGYPSDYNPSVLKILSDIGIIYLSCMTLNKVIPIILVGLI